MPIHPSDPPAAAVEAVRRAVANRAGKSKFPRSNLSVANPNAVSISMPHRIAHLPLGNIHRAANLRTAAVLGNWRFLVHETKRRIVADNDGREEPVPIAAATMVTSAAGTYELGELNEGSFVAATEEGIRRAEKLPEVQKGRFEALLLIVPAVYVVALWLQDRDGDADLLLTMPPSNPALVPYRPMTSPAFLDILHKLAQKVPSDDVTRG
ncbi:hypothetical protein IVA87_02150 [Bradyrhizobium sp. 147]|jgi:hypothetical protein|uniref:hypothetical protein n=1 Tax=unclassified Bradyrhizobium TaxID=2631580 RepID=UPI001FFB3F7F|nr:MULTISPECIES: hypothetical protein [unclassified Bradyrhizobium]MCK1542563.1 hypothetical protein [Bradyrhizobium sp. 179]MCK1627371.1 hypothetical protein [Bradyrhizobium sp. 160]MCK1678304.1 hypothetical protein [Bradyrhizobium sp. 147]